MSEFLALDLPELRRRMEDHQATRPTDLFGADMQTWLKTKGRIAFAIELKEAEAKQKPFYITVPPQPFEDLAPQPLLRLRKTKAIEPEPTTQEVRHAVSPGNAGAPGAPDAPESPMPKAAHAAPPAPPATRLAALIEKLNQATVDCQAAPDKPAFKTARAKIHSIRWQIRGLVMAHQLEEPTLPEVPANPFAAAPQQDAPPHQLGTASGPVAALPLEPGDLVIDRHGHTTPLEDLGKLPPPADPAINPIMEERSFSYVQRLVLKRISILNDVSPSREEWRQIARDLAILETTAGAARQIAERHAEVA